LAIGSAIDDEARPTRYIGVSDRLRRLGHLLFFQFLERRKFFEYETGAREAQRLAENSLSEADRAAWLRIAEQWLRLLRPAGSLDHT
jgi:hypothetical protein